MGELKLQKLQKNVLIALQEECLQCIADAIKVLNTFTHFMGNVTATKPVTNYKKGKSRLLTELFLAHKKVVNYR